MSVFTALVPLRQHGMEDEVPTSRRSRSIGTREVLALALVTALVCWFLGLLLAPDRKPFFYSREWHVQPFFLAAHIVALHLFVQVYRLNFNAGLNNFDIPHGDKIGELRRVFSPWACLLAALVSIPFSFMDFLYASSSSYPKLGGGDALKAVDVLMWGLWATEWFLNALIWVLMLGFLVRSCWVIQRYRFKFPIEVVLHERHYRPLLRMSAQGATVLLGFSFITVFYIWYTGGELTDYLGLAITAGLLLTGFVTPWLMLKAKIDRGVRLEMTKLRQQLARDMDRSRLVGPAHEKSPPHPLEHRLNEVLGMLRITYLEQRHGSIGQTEAREVMLRMLAPLVTVVWQFRQHAAEVWANLGGMIQSLLK